MCSGVGVGVVAGAVPGHAGGGARAARGAAGRRAARALHRLLRLHARRPRAQPLQQGRRRARQCSAHDAQGLDFVLLCGMRRFTVSNLCIMLCNQRSTATVRAGQSLRITPLITLHVCATVLYIV